ncbi:MAG: PQQ-like beta-propeller repeat protein, partial [Phycisphaerales bacterium]|nr:PQQ-like beta-propeller repeat protein [Phycisphaerales bacterium]
MRAAALLGVAFTLGSAVSVPVQAQTNNPVYVDDSPRTATALEGVRDLAASDNLTEAVRVLQSLLDEEGSRVIAASGDADLFIPVRTRIHQELLANPDLLARYQRIEGPNAQRLLEEGRFEEIERAHLMTEAGCEAVLRLSQQLYESARFEAAWLMLRQLDRHPARVGFRREQARELLISIVGYLGLQDPADIDREVRDEAWALIDRWSQQANVAAPAQRAPLESPIKERFHSPWFNETLPDMEHLVAHPLPSVTFVESEELLDSLSPRSTSSMPPNAQFLYVMPAVAGDIVYLNDGVSISAWNRFTLNREWSVRTDNIDPGYRAAVGPSFEGTTSVTVEGPWVVGITGLNARSFSSTRQYITAIEAESGDVLWQTTARSLPDPTLADLIFRGPVIIDQRTVVLAASKQSSQRGLESRYLVGLDLITGEMRWARPLGSAGALRHGPRALEQDMPVSRSGVTYYTDPVGFVAAVESSNGRVQWIRRLESESNQFDTREPWEGSAPVVVDDRVYTLTPDRLAIHAYERETGKLKAQVSAAHFDGPRYILYADGMILGVTRRAIWGRPAEDLDAPMETLQLAQVPDPGIRGRVVVVGDELVVPVVNGLRIVAAHAEGPEHFRHLSLDDPGNVLPVESGLIVVDDRQFHPYLVWEVAERILRERMAARPEDATDAVTLAALAHRAGRNDLIVPTVDRAIRAIDADPSAPSSEKNRARLFRTLLDMIEPPPSLPTTVRLSDALRSDLLDRLGITAANPLEKVAHLMARGQFYETIDQPRKAVESYQAILGDERLVQTSYSQFENTVSAEAEARRRLRRIIRAHGTQVYDVFDQEAARQLAAAQSDPEPAAFEKIARQYPMASVTPRAWLAAAERYQSRQRGLLSIHAT